MAAAIIRVSTKGALVLIAMALHCCGLPDGVSPMSVSVIAAKRLSLR